MLRYRYTPSTNVEKIDRTAKQSLGFVLELLDLNAVATIYPREVGEINSPFPGLFFGGDSVLYHVAHGPIKGSGALLSG